MMAEGDAGHEDKSTSGASALAGAGEPSAEGHGALELCWRDRFSLDLSLGAVRSQFEILNVLRAQAGVLLGALGVAIALLLGGISKCKLEWAGLSSMVMLFSAMGALMVILWPKTNWGGGLSPKVVGEEYRLTKETDEVVLVNLLNSLAGQKTTNEERLGRLYAAYRLAIVLLFVGFILATYQGGLCSP